MAVNITNNAQQHFDDQTIYMHVCYKLKHTKKLKNCKITIGLGQNCRLKFTEALSLSMC